MTLDEWFHAYLLKFGTETIDNPQIQEGEVEFLKEMGMELFPDLPSGFYVHLAFQRIQEAWALSRRHS